MPQVSSKHQGRETSFSFQNYTAGLLENIAPLVARINQLTACSNLKYQLALAPDANGKISTMLYLTVRQGTTKLTSTALSSSVVAATYYQDQAKYIIATTTQLYYLDAAGTPTLIGTIEGVPTFSEFNEKLIIHDGGVTKYWDGTTFGKINSAIEDEVIGTGDGSAVTFSDTLVNYPVEPSTVTVSYYHTSTLTATDDGSNRLTGSVASALNIAGVSLTSPCEVTITGHGLSVENSIHIKGITGTTQLNGNIYPFTIKDANTLTLTGVDATGFTAYVSGGTASLSWVNYATGAIQIKCSSSADSSTNLTVDYEKADGAPKSKAGLVRASRLLLWGDPDNPARIWTSGVGNEKEWDTSVGGRWDEVEPEDGYPVTGCSSFYDRVIVVKENGIFYLNSFPGETDYAVLPLMPQVSGNAYRTIKTIASQVFFLGQGGVMAISPTESFGDATSKCVSGAFQVAAMRYANASSYAEYNELDGQYWLGFCNAVTASDLAQVYVLDKTFGLLSKYQFAFTHSCFVYVNGEMLIGGANGNLYKLVSDQSTFYDDHVSYDDYTFFTTAFTDWQSPNNKKHNKKINVRLSARCGMSGNLKIYLDRDALTPFATISLLDSAGDVDIADLSVDISELTGWEVGSVDSTTNLSYKFTYDSIMMKLTDISTCLGCDIFGIDLKAAALGD